MDLDKILQKSMKIKVFSSLLSLVNNSKKIHTILLLYIYISWLCWVFIAAPVFSRCGERGLLCSCSAWASHCSGFSCCGASDYRVPGLQELQHVGSVVVALGLSCSVACGIFPDQRSTCLSYVDRGILYHWANRETPHYHLMVNIQ